MPRKRVYWVLYCLNDCWLALLNLAGTAAWHERLSTICSANSDSTIQRHRFLYISQCWARHGGRAFHSHLLTDSPIWVCHPLICCLIDECSESISNVCTSYVYTSSLCGCQFTVLAHYLRHFLYLFVCEGVYTLRVHYVHTSCQVSVYYVEQ